MGGKKSTLGATAIINPETNKLAVLNTEIKEISLKYCKETLANNDSDEALKKRLKLKRKLWKIC